MNATELLNKWDLFLREVRDFFYKKNYTEVYTPTLVKSPGVDAAIDFWQANWASETYYLPTSPELHMKKILSLGLKQIFEIKNCFRGDYISQAHLHEFHMLEWYHVGLSFDDLKHETVELIQGLSGIKTPVVETTIQKTLLEKWDFDFSVTTSVDDLKTFCRAQKIDFAEDDLFEDLFSRIYMDKIETTFDPKVITIVCDFPSQLASLAKINQQGWTDRFEVYWKGRELANAFNELLNADQNRTRFEQESRLRQSQGKSAIPLDEDFFKSLERGVPPTVGIALGLERLFMSIHDLDDIRIFQSVF